MKRSILAVASLLMSCSSFDDSPPAPAPAAPTVIGLPATCVTADPKDSPECVDERVGVFVDPTGGDDVYGDGTKAKPLRTVAKALEKQRRIFICGGRSDEAIVLARTISLDGGFACGSWQYTGAKARFAPRPGQYALKIEGAQDVVVSDLELAAADATDEGGNSIALFAVRAGVTLRRAAIFAGAGKTGKKGDPGTVDRYVAGDGIGNNGIRNGAAGAAKICTCTTGATTTGGAGGSEANGSHGEWYYYLFPGGGGGIFGNACSAGGQGQDGSRALPVIEYGPASKSRGSLLATGFVPGAGGVGRAGGIGAGGGGGAGPAYAPGGSGGCGGCGGLGGKGGGGGGASIGIAAIDAAIVVRSSTIKSAAAGDGATGGAGGAGALGGLAGGAADGAVVISCGGGSGGDGSAGAPGGGGAGGISIGILFLGVSPSVDETSAVTPGPAGKGNREQDFFTPESTPLDGVSEAIKDATTL